MLAIGAIFRRYTPAQMWQKWAPCVWRRSHSLHIKDNLQQFNKLKASQTLFYFIYDSRWQKKLYSTEKYDIFGYLIWKKIRPPVVQYEKNNVWSHVINEQFSWDKIIAVSFNQNFKEYFVLLGLIYNIK